MILTEEDREYIGELVIKGDVPYRDAVARVLRERPAPAPFCIHYVEDTGTCRLRSAGGSPWHCMAEDRSSCSDRTPAQGQLREGG